MVGVNLLEIASAASCMDVRVSVGDDVGVSNSSGRAGVIAKSGDQLSRVSDPVLLYAQKLLEDCAFREGFCSALSHRMARRTIDCSTLRDTLRQVALEAGPFTQARPQHIKLICQAQRIAAIFEIPRSSCFVSSQPWSP